MATNGESEEAREERLRRRRERDGTRRQSETPEERDARLARRREYDRNRRAALRSRQTESEQLESTSVRNEQCRLRRLAESPDERDTRLARRREYDRRRHTGITTNEHFSPPEVDDPVVINRMQQFHLTMSALQNVLCEICSECFLSSTTNVPRMCNRCRADSEIPKLYFVENNMLGCSSLPSSVLRICG